MELVRELSRLDEESKSKYGKEQDSYGHTHTSSVHVTGRIVLNIWRLLRSELALTSYTLESCVYHVLHYRCVDVSLYCRQNGSLLLLLEHLLSVIKI